MVNNGSKENQVKSFEIVSLATSHDELWRVHRAGCADAIKDARGQGDIIEKIEAPYAAEAVELYLEGELAEMGYTSFDFKVLSCAR